jgi:hypothetical protein
MNRNQLQIEVCKALLNPCAHIAMAEINEEEVAITTNGITCYVFWKKECVFDLTKIRVYEALKEYFPDNENDVEIKTTGKIFRSSSGDFIEKFAGDGFVVYVNTKHTKQFSGSHYYTDGALNRILVKDQYGRLMGLFLPMKYEEKEN